MNITDTPAEYHEDLQKAVNLLNTRGFDEVYLFGSLADASSHADSDIDIAVRGIKSEDYFKIYGELLMLCDHSLDLVDLDLQKQFGEKLIKNGFLKRVS